VIDPAQPGTHPVLILLLNQLGFGCAGYYLIGQKKKAIAALALWILGLITCGIVSVLVAFVTAIDGYLQAQRLQAGHAIGEWTFFNQQQPSS
jgi:ABC-type transport system involved in multi-copper enzyme maturation permease subunit